MSRGRKLLIVGTVLAIGLGLAWPFRKVEHNKNYDSVAKAVPHSKAVPQPSFHQLAPATQQMTANVRQQLGAPAPHVTAKMASMAESHRSGSVDPKAATFDLANHPALANTPMLPNATTVENPPSMENTMAMSANSPVTPAVPPAMQKVEPQRVSAYTVPGHQQSRPVYPTSDRDRPFEPAEQREQIRHVVQNSDTLEKIAKRYLGDEGRALEIFDLNREVLDNPHLLPIDAELRIPADAKVTID